jgi:pimeloyl-ACP methyl ester carboxylesterase
MATWRTKLFEVVDSRMINNMKFFRYFYDENYVRFRLAKTNQGTNFYNWLFLPGGPGADSSYYLSLIEELDMAGNFWLIDFPANGSNLQNPGDSDYNFDLWEDYFIPAINRFENPILVGQSFGGMFPLLFPILETILKGFVILSSAPRLWFDDAARYAKENNASFKPRRMKVF